MILIKLIFLNTHQFDNMHKLILKAVLQALLSVSSLSKLDNEFTEFYSSGFYVILVNILNLFLSIIY